MTKNPFPPNMTKNPLFGVALSVIVLLLVASPAQAGRRVAPKANKFAPAVQVGAPTAAPIAAGVRRRALSSIPIILVLANKPVVSSN